MLKQYHRVVGNTFRLIDGFVIGLVWVLSYALRFYVPLIPVTKGFPAFETYIALAPLIMVLWMIVFSSFGAYRSGRMLRRTHEAHLILKAHFAALLIFIALTYLFSEYKYSRGVIVYFGIVGAFALVVFRLTLRNFLRSLRKKGYNLRYAIAVGEGAALEHVMYRMNKFPELGIRVKGVIASPQSETKDVLGIPVVGKFGDLKKIISETEVDQILISLPRNQYHELDEVLRILKDETVEVQLIPDIHEFITLGCEIEEFEGLPIVNLNNSPLNGWSVILKRFTDIILSGIALITISPILLFISILIKLTSRGPIFYSQVRMGLDGRTFKMYKFRSMRVDAEQESGAVWAAKSDGRKTKFGSFLRATSLDELPQFWNVFRGEMSLVGPRPERPVFVEKFRSEVPHYMLRHKVKAGITGWAQVNGWRGNTSLDRRIEFDLYYIRNWSYLFDLRILFATLWKGFIDKNAY